MKPYLIPAESICYTEEIKKAVLLPILHIQKVLMPQRSIFNPLKLNTQMLGTIAGHLLQGAQMILSS